MNETAGSIPGARDMALARQAARDSWIFLSLGLVALGVVLALGGCPYGVRTLGNIGYERGVGLVVAASACLVFHGFGSWKILRARWAGVRGAASFVAAGIAWLCIVSALTLLSVMLPIRDATIRWPITAAIPTLALAIGLGTGLARWRKKELPSWRRRLAFILPLAVLLLVLVTCTVGIAVYAFRSPYTEPVSSWVWHVPEWVRAPACALVVAASPKTELRLAYTGMLPFGQLRQVATDMCRASNISAGTAWDGMCHRDPHAALGVALSLPLGARSRSSIGEQVFGAGQTIGKFGTEDHIVERIRQGASNELLSGIADTYYSRPVPAKIVKAAAERIEGLDDPPTALYTFCRNPAMAEKLLGPWVRAPGKVALGKLRSSEVMWEHLDPSASFIAQALQEEEPELRKTILRLLSSNQRHAEWPRNLFVGILTSLEGTRPNVRNDERRYAWQAASWLLRPGQRGHIPSYEQAAVSGLTPAEQQAILNCATAIRAKLRLPPPPPVPAPPGVSKDAPATSSPVH